MRYDSKEIRLLAGEDQRHQCPLRENVRHALLDGEGVEGLTFLSLDFDVFSGGDQVRDRPIV